MTYRIWIVGTQRYRYPSILDDISPYPGDFVINVRAAENAPLGPSSLTVRVSSTSKAYTASLPLEVVDGEGVPTCTEDGRICAGG